MTAVARTPVLPGPGSQELGVVRVRWSPTAQWATVLGIGFAAIAALIGNPAQCALGAALLAMVATDRVVAGRALRDPTFRCSLPPVSVAGDTLGLLVSVDGATRPVRIELIDPWRGAAGAAEPGDDGVLPVAGPPRGLVHAVAAELVVVGPVGLVSAQRRIRWWLSVPAAVGPRDLEVRSSWPEPTGALIGLDARSPRGHELTRGVRDYRPGDPRRRVHWKATARVGRLMVRETEGEAVGLLTVVVAIDGPSDAAEAAVSRARWYAEEGLRRGWSVHLVTAESSAPFATLPPVDLVWSGGALPFASSTPWLHASEPAVGSRVVDGPVGSTRDILLRLAAAVPGEVPAPRRPGAVRRVSEQGDVWL